MSGHFNDLLNLLKLKNINNPKNPDSMQMKDIIGLYLQYDMTLNNLKHILNLLILVLSLLWKA
ncbi:hypothetical protein [Neobacillus drentensis]|uniref:hypothetical protein n=1 Tax=Neobacillus drentensis TaxID=220684 RepID=UPI0008265D90|nr:hypothetical protein [Neobacillus drentensis]